MSVLHLDIETRSTVDLRKTGVYVYAEDPATDVILACWAVDDGPVHTWLARQALPIELFDALRCAAGGEVAVVAHNAAFERTLHRHVLTRRYGWPELPLEAFDCTMSRARAMGLPGSLDGALGAMGAPFTKDRQGHSLMLRMCKPRRIENDGTVVWWEDAARIERLAAYCAVDVQGERWLDKRILPLSPEERRVWLADQRLNDRGVPIDLDFCRAAIEVSNKTRDLLDKEMRAVTGGAVPKASNVARLRDWLISKNVMIQPPVEDDELDDEEDDEEGPKVPELRRNDVERLLRDALDGSPVKRALEIRLEAGKSSVKKIDAMLRRVQPDGRVRGMLTYWGAGPGRWSAAGSGIQLQNLPRDGVKNWDRARRLLDDGPEAVDLLEGPPLDVLSRMLRGAILAPEGDDLIFADLASVEARGVAWLAGQDDLVDAFASGAKIYEEMGALIFDMDVSAVLKESFERWVGKGVVLGCLAEGTMVLTDRGAVPIQYVKPTDKLWDGIEWVSHGGVIATGTKPTLRLSGIWLTPDHRVWCGTQWREAQSLERDESILSQALGYGRAHLPSPATFSASGGASPRWWSSANAGGMSIPLRTTTSNIFEALGALSALGKAALRAARSIGATLRSSLISSTVLGCSTGLRPALTVAITPATATTGTTVQGACSFTKHGAPTAGRFFGIWSAFPAGISPNWNLTGSTSTGATRQETYASSAGQRTSKTVEKSPTCKIRSHGLRRSSPTFDIALAGPRSRFTVLAEDGLLVVHNCGYQMGAPKFVATCAKSGRDVPLALSERAISSYRTRFPRIPALWYGMQDAAIAAVRNPDSVQVVPEAGGRVSFAMFKKWLQMTLPSGRKISYRNPSIQWDERFGRHALTYMGTDSKTKQWGVQRTYGGRLTENAVQGMCRDLIAHRLVDLEDAGYAPILLVHDETITEQPAGRGSREQMIEIMTRLPAWAEGFPLAADGRRARRYRK